MMRRHPRDAFSLIELLVVIAIAAIVMSFALPAFNSTMRGMQLTQGTQLMDAQLHLARQTALTKNRPVEVRLYSYADPGAAGSSASYRALQSFQMNDDGTFSAVGKVVILPDAIIIDSGAALSSMIALAQPAPNVPASSAGSALGATIPRVGTQYNSIAFHFLPDGSTNLPATGQQWFFSLHYETLGNNLSALPPNFATVQIDPYNGQTRIFRP